MGGQGSTVSGRTRTATGGATRAQLPAGAVPLRPYVLTQLLADLGASPTSLTERAVARIHRSLPVPTEQEVLWADVAFGTRLHGVVLTDAALYLKDGPADDDELDDELEDDADDEDEGVLATLLDAVGMGSRSGRGSSDGRGAGASGSRALDRPGTRAARAEATDDPRGVEVDGLGYVAVRWESFDAARISHIDGDPTLDGALFLDGRIFRRLAMACVRINNRRVRMRRAGRRLARELGVLGAQTPVRSVCRSSAGATVDFCFDAEDEYKFYDEQGAPLALEVPADQYDAALQRMRRRIAEGCVPPLDDPDLAGVLVRRGWYTRTQAVNLARTGRVPNVALSEKTGSVICRRPEGLGFWLELWLRGRSGLARGVVDGSAERSEQLGDAVGQALGAGAQLRADEQATKKQLATRQVGSLIASNAASHASYMVGATGARVLLGAVGAVSGPIAMIASLALGNVCGRAGMEAFSMVKDLFVEPKARIFERLFGGVLANVAFEHALTGAEQALLGELMARADPALFQRLGAALADAPSQEAEIRALLDPMVAAIRRA